MGTETSVTLGPDGTVKPIAKAAATPNDAELQSLDFFAKGDPPETLDQRTVAAPKRTPPAPGQLKIRLTRPEDKSGQSLLVVENGYTDAVVYRATIKADRKKPTDVCLVLPSNYSVEHWPYSIDWIKLDSFKLVQWRQGDPQPCA